MPRSDALSLAGPTEMVSRPQTEVDVSIIIVSWNVRELLRRCLESIISTQGNLSVEILIVDNASSDRTPEMVRGEFDQARLIVNGSNLGFGAANNVGLAQAWGRYVFFLNPDTQLCEGALSRMIDFLDRDERFDLVGPRLIDPDGTLQRACARTLPSVVLTLFEALYLHRLPFIGQRLDGRLLSPYDLDESQPVDAISGAAMLGRRDVMVTFGGFDESFMHTAEDMDLCLRLRRSGIRIFYLSDARIIHIGGQSSALASVRAGTMSIISTREYFRRSRGWAYALLYRLIVQLIQMPMLLLVGVGKAIIGRGSDGLRARFRFAKAVWAWRVED